MTSQKIRRALPTDTPALLEVALDSGLFPEEGLDELSEMLAAYFEGVLGDAHVWLVDEEEGQIRAGAYYAPEVMTDRVWNLYFIAVRERAKGQGRGSALLGHVEHTLREQGQRMLLIETSGLGTFERTRDFYLKHDYEEEARLRDFYEEGDDKVVFRKLLN